MARPASGPATRKNIHIAGAAVQWKALMARVAGVTSDRYEVTARIPAA